MNKTFGTGRKLKSLAMAAALGSATLLTACGSEPEAPVEVEGTISGMTIENPRMVLNAVDGNPAAVYFDLKYDGDRAFSLDRAKVAGAGSAVIHDYGEYDSKMQMMEALPIPLSKGSTLSFKPGGLHVMVFDLSDDLKAGGKAEVTLKVSGGKTHKFQADILAAGDERATGNGAGNGDEN